MIFSDEEKIIYGRSQSHNQPEFHIHSKLPRQIILALVWVYVLRMMTPL